MNLIALIILCAIVLDSIVNIMLSSYSLKFLIALGLTPVIYAGHALVQRLLGLEPVPHETEVTSQSA